MSQGALAGSVFVSNPPSQQHCQTRQRLCSLQISSQHFRHYDCPFMPTMVQRDSLTCAAKLVYEAHAAKLAYHSHVTVH